MPVYKDLVANYSAVDTGLSDTSSAFQSALNDINSAGGGTLRVPAGTFRIDHDLTVYSNTRIVGDGMFSSLITFGSYNDSAAAFLMTNRDNVTFEGLGFNGAGEDGGLTYFLRWNTTSGTHTNGVVRNCHFQNLQDTGASEFMVQFVDTQDCLVEGCIFEGCQYGLGFKVSNQDVNRNLCIACEFKSFRTAGIYVDITDQDSYGFMVRDCKFHTPDSDGNISSGLPKMIPMHFTGPHNGTNWHRNVLIANNVLHGKKEAHNDGEENATSEQITLEDVLGGCVTGNTSFFGGESGIYLYNCRNLAVVGNQCDQNNDHGIHLQGAKRCAVVGNSCTNNGKNFDGAMIGSTAGIILLSDGGSDISTEDNLVVGNVCTDDQSGKTQDYGLRLGLSGSGASVLGTNIGGNLLSGNSTGELLDPATDDAAADNILETLYLDPQFQIIDALYDLSGTPAADITITTFAAGTYVRSVQAIILRTVTGASSAVKIGVGISGQPVLYGKTTNLTANQKFATRANRLLTASETVKIYAVLSGDTAGGTLTGSADIIRVRIVYEAPIADLVSYT